MKSYTLQKFEDWTETAEDEEIDFVDSVFFLCENNNSHDASHVLTLSPEQIVSEFADLNDVRDFCGIDCEDEEISHMAMECAFSEDFS